MDSSRNFRSIRVVIFIASLRSILIILKRFTSRTKRDLTRQPDKSKLHVNASCMRLIRNNKHCRDSNELAMTTLRKKSNSNI
jgi:hypothetical protein